MKAIGSAPAATLKDIPPDVAEALRAMTVAFVSLPRLPNETDGEKAARFIEQYLDSLP